MCWLLEEDGEKLVYSNTLGRERWRNASGTICTTTLTYPTSSTEYCGLDNGSCVVSHASGYFDLALNNRGRLSRAKTYTLFTTLQNR